MVKKRFFLKNEFHKKTATVIATPLADNGIYAISEKQMKNALKKTCTGGAGCKCYFSLDGYYVVDEKIRVIFLPKQQVCSEADHAVI